MENGAEEGRKAREVAAAGDADGEEPAEAEDTRTLLLAAAHSTDSPVEQAGKGTSHVAGATRIPLVSRAAAE